MAIFTIIRELLLILGTLPVSVASAERSFLKLRRLYIKINITIFTEFYLTAISLFFGFKNNVYAYILGFLFTYFAFAYTTYIIYFS